MMTNNKVKLRKDGLFNQIYVLDISDLDERNYRPFDRGDFRTVTGHFSDDFGHTFLRCEVSGETIVYIADTNDLAFYDEGDE